MEVKIIKGDKNDVEISVQNLTVAEVLRTYLNNQGVEFAAWRREHPSKPVLFKIKSSGGTVKKAVRDAIAAIKRDEDSILKGLKK